METMMRPFYAFKQMDTGSRDLFVSIGVSVLLHIFLLVIISVYSGNVHDVKKMPSVIDVDLMHIQASSVKKAVKRPEEKIRKKKIKQKTVKKKTVKKKKRIAAAKKIKPQKKKNEKKVASSKDVINDAISRLKNEVKKADLRKDAGAGERPVGEKKPSENKTGPGINVTDREALLIARYVSEVKVLIQENWSFSSSLTGRSQKLETRIMIKVMSDGEIKGAKITKKSGNSYMDSAASMAVRKSNPVHPFPDGIAREFISIDIGFSPE